MTTIKAMGTKAISDQLLEDIEGASVTDETDGVVTIQCDDDCVDAVEQRLRDNDLAIVDDAMPTRSVNDYETGEALDGAASDELIAKSEEAAPTGAVKAYLDDSGVWQYVADSEADRYRRTRGCRIVTVWVE